MIREIDPLAISDDARALLPVIGDRVSSDTGAYAVVVRGNSGDWCLDPVISRWDTPVRSRPRTAAVDSCPPRRLDEQPAQRDATSSQHARRRAARGG